jgi:hypothetical protein
LPAASGLSRSFDRVTGLGSGQTPVEHLFRSPCATISQNPETHSTATSEKPRPSRSSPDQLHGIFVTDDRSARMLAAKHNVRTATTWDLLRLATRVGLVDENTVWGCIQTLGSLGRGQPPGVHARPSFELWIK